MEFMKEAVKEAYEGINKGHGGPFGSVIVKEGKIIGKGHNKVILNQDPTCHGEMEAIRDACANIGSFDLSGAILYTTAQPCPMCLGATLWANIKEVRYGCTIKDTDEIGFRDDVFYKFLDGENDILDIKELGRKECKELFNDYANISDKQNY